MRLLLALFILCCISGPMAHAQNGASAAGSNEAGNDPELQRPENKVMEASSQFCMDGNCYGEQPNSLDPCGAGASIGDVSAGGCIGVSGGASRTSDSSPAGVTH